MFVTTIFDLYSTISISKAKMDRRKGEKNAVNWKEYPYSPNQIPFYQQTADRRSTLLEMFHCNKIYRNRNKRMDDDGFEPWREDIYHTLLWNKKDSVVIFSTTTTDIFIFPKLKRIRLWGSERQRVNNNNVVVCC